MQIIHSGLHSNFYPRSPCGERPAHVLGFGVSAVISIHALLAESDDPALRAQKVKPDFYPRSPCGERRASRLFRAGVRQFLSTLSLRRATHVSSI